MTSASSGQSGSVLASPGAILFDLDDTLYPERMFVDGGFQAVATYLAPQVGRSAHELKRRLWELHARDGRGRLFDSLLAEHGVADDPDLVLACLLAYRTHRVRLEPFGGVAELLDTLRGSGIPTGIVSDGNAGVQYRKLVGLWPAGGRFDVIVLTDELGPACAKPSPVPFRVACRLLGVEPATAVYVGNDPRKDVSGARAAGLRTVRVGSRPDEGGSVDNPAQTHDDPDLVVGPIGSLLARLADASTSHHAKVR